MTTAQTVLALQIQADQAKPISPDLFGIFFEDLNYAADGGLYAELIQNRSFEYSPADLSDWNFFTAWNAESHGGRYSIALGDTQPIHPNNPHYLVLRTDGPVALRNYGFDGIAVKAGESYKVSLFARVLEGTFGALVARLESRTGETLGEVTLGSAGGEWQQLTATLSSSADDRFGRFVLLIDGAGALALDVVSLFPSHTFRERDNGLRADLAQAIADLQPRFIRFPGGCLAHGDGLDNMYRWKDTIGPIETRREQRNIWNYHQSVGLGYYEYFLFCEDIGAKPVPVVPAGVCCQNSGAQFNGRWGEGQEGLPLAEIPDYIQEVLDLIAWANGPADSFWGAKRAEAGHPEPFGLEYLAIGNEDRITPVFKERFTLIYEAVKTQHPEITIIGTVGPFTEGEDYEAGWEIANELRLAMVDEHGYMSPDWYWEHLRRFDAYDRDAATVYLGEYAAHETDRKNTLRSALAESAYMTTLERNGDVVRLSSYAPLLAKQGHTQWVPNLIYFDNTRVFPSINYLVQQLFSQHAGDQYLPFTGLSDEDEQHLAISCVRETTSGDVVLKIVSRASAPIQVQIDLTSIGNIAGQAKGIIVTGNPLAENAFGREPEIVPEQLTIAATPQLSYTIPACSLSVIRLQTAS